MPGPVPVVLTLSLTLIGQAALPSAGQSALKIETVQPAEADWPDSAQARAVRAFVGILNDPRPERVREFEETFRGATGRAAVPIDVRVERMGELSAQFAPVRVERIEGVGSDLRVQIRGAEGTPIVLGVVADGEDPARIDGVTLNIGSELVSGEALPDSAIDAIVRASADAMRQHYVFPDKGEAMADLILRRLGEGAYAARGDSRALAAALQADMRAVTNDRHITVRPMPQASRADPQGVVSAGPEGGNFGFREARILPGNIGYLRLDGFVPGPEAERTAAGAMAFLRHCDAIIYDLRNNGGGNPGMIRFLTSYLFDSPTHLNDMIDREGNVVEEYWTLESVPGERLRAGIPAYVLTSAGSFSGAEEFSYNLKHLGRATIVGERTGGGAHPVMRMPIEGTFLLGVPYMRARNPISGTNWEGVGVEPDVAVPADEALERAQQMAQEVIRMGRRAR